MTSFGKSTKETGYTTIGFSSILVIFVMLALTTFTVLTMVSANADYKLSKRVAERTSAYYEADARCEEKLAVIEDRLKGIYEETGALDKSRVQNALQDLEGVTVETEGLAVTAVSYSEAISSNQELQVELFVPTTVRQGDALYELSQWRVATIETESVTLDGEGLHLLGTE